MRPLALLLLASCATAPVVMHVPAGYDEAKHWQPVDEIGVPARLVRTEVYTENEHTGSPGEIHVWVFNGNLPEESGHAHRSFCKPVIEIEKVSLPVTLAHEIGHALGLQHADKKDWSNFMHPQAGLTGSTPEQLATMRAAAQRFRLCRKVKQ